MTTFKPGDKVRRVGSSARWGIWLHHPVVTVRAIDPNGPLLFHGLGGWYRPEPFELVPEQVKLDPDKWTHEQGTHYSQVRTTNPSPMVMAMWVLTELAREGCLAWFGNSAKPEPGASLSTDAGYGSIATSASIKVLVQRIPPEFRLMYRNIK